MRIGEFEDWGVEYFCCSVFVFFRFFINGERKLGRLVDALALGGDEGRDKLR